MSIRFFCPECDARVLAPEDAAGDYVDCRRCGTEVRVPSPRGRRADSDEDERPRSRRRRDDSRDERGSRSGKRRKPKRSKLPLILALVGTGIVGLLIIGGGIAIHRYVWADPPGTKTIAGEKWYPADEKSSLFTAYFPGDTPEYDRVAVKPPAFLGNRFGNGEDLGLNMQSWVCVHGRREYSVFLFKMPNNGRHRDNMAQAIVQGGRTPDSRVVSDEQVTVSGHTGRRIVTRGGGRTTAAMSFLLGDGQELVIFVAGSDDFDHKDPMVATFFDNLTIH